MRHPGQSYGQTEEVFGAQGLEMHCEGEGGVDKWANEWGDGQPELTDSRHAVTRRPVPERTSPRDHRLNNPRNGLQHTPSVQRAWNNDYHRTHPAVVCGFSSKFTSQTAQRAAPVSELEFRGHAAQSSVVLLGLLLA